jgi:hypothetical protein
MSIVLFDDDPRDDRYGNDGHGPAFIQIFIPLAGELSLAN